MYVSICQRYLLMIHKGQLQGKSSIWRSSRTWSNQGGKNPQVLKMWIPEGFFSLTVPLFCGQRRTEGIMEGNLNNFLKSGSANLLTFRNWLNKKGERHGTLIAFIFMNKGIQLNADLKLAGDSTIWRGVEEGSKSSIHFHPSTSYQLHFFSLSTPLYCFTLF